MGIETNHHAAYFSNLALPYAALYLSNGQVSNDDLQTADAQDPRGWWLSISCMSRLLSLLSSLRNAAHLLMASEHMLTEPLEFGNEGFSHHQLSFLCSTKKNQKTLLRNFYRAVNSVQNLSKFVGNL